MLQRIDYFSVLIETLIPKPFGDILRIVDVMLQQFTYFPKILTFGIYGTHLYVCYISFFAFIFFNYILNRY